MREFFFFPELKQIRIDFQNVKLMKLKEFSNSMLRDLISRVSVDDSNVTLEHIHTSDLNPIPSTLKKKKSFYRPESVGKNWESHLTNPFEKIYTEQRNGQIPISISLPI